MIARRQRRRVGSSMLRIDLGVGAAVLAAAALVLGGCAVQSGPASGPPSSSPLFVAPVGPVPTAAAPVAAAVRPVAGAPSSTRPAASGSVSAQPGSSSPQVASTSSPPLPRASTPRATPRSTCTRIGVRVLRGSAAYGREFAALQFTNTGPTTCRLNGYPTVRLRRQAAMIGTASEPATNKTSTYLLAPGATAESLLNDYVSCQAPLSDSVRVVVPGSSLHSVRPGQLRACTLRVTALAAPQ